MSTHHCMHCDCANKPALEGDRKRCCFCGEVKGVESNLVAHARREMLLLETDPWMIEMVIRVIKAFANSGHSGGSASFAIPVIYELLQFHNITPLTDNPEEWHQPDSSQPGLWQSIRNPAAMSDDEGRTYILVSEARENPEDEPNTYESFPMNPEIGRLFVDPFTLAVREWKGTEEGWVVVFDPAELEHAIEAKAIMEDTSDEEAGTAGDIGSVVVRNGNGDVVSETPVEEDVTNG